jgi:hypothetical protein
LSTDYAALAQALAQMNVERFVCHNPDGTTYIDLPLDRIPSDAVVARYVH